MLVIKQSKVCVNYLINSDNLKFIWSTCMDVYFALCRFAFIFLLCLLSWFVDISWSFFCCLLIFSFHHNLKKIILFHLKKNQTSYLLLVCHVSFSNALFVPGWKGLQFCCILFSSFYIVYVFNFLTFFSFRVYWRNSSRVQEELTVPLQWWTANIPCRRQSGLV